MARALCIHGHFYQPPREDPWLGRILPEGSAAPSRHWNERICRESYAPLAQARRLDDQGRIIDLVNCYAWMSFNVGPTLLSWMARSAPDTYARILEADRESVRRLGHGNALAQIYHHVIMPLASAADKEPEVAWAVDDFTARFGRTPEGMWLSETAVDTPTLEVLAAAGIRFTILDPSQAEAISDDGRSWRPVDAGSLPIGEPYAVALPSGRSIAVFFYHGALSQAVAFERLLADGEQFFRRLSQAAGPGLLSLATDGETYGHHFTFGEMALAYVLDQARSGRDGLTLTNFGAFLADNPPRRFVRIREASAWSCAHGVERWRADCGCTTGGHPGYNQRWRKPLRQALDGLSASLADHFATAGRTRFPDPREALLAYGRVLSGAQTPEAFEAAHMAAGLSRDDRAAAWKLLAMRQWGLASLASCAWFFDEISRLEPVNALTFALRAMELARETGLADPEPTLTATLAQAVSNEPDKGTGRDIWETMVRPRRETPRSLLAQALLTLELEERLPHDGSRAVAAWPGVSVAVSLTETAPGRGLLLRGRGPAGQQAPVPGRRLRPPRRRNAFRHHAAPGRHRPPAGARAARGPIHPHPGPPLAPSLAGAGLAGHLRPAPAQGTGGPAPHLPAGCRAQFTGAGGPGSAPVRRSGPTHRRTGPGFRRPGPAGPPGRRPGPPPGLVAGPKRPVGPPAPGRQGRGAGPGPGICRVDAWRGAGRMPPAAKGRCPLETFSAFRWLFF